MLLVFLGGAMVGATLTTLVMGLFIGGRDDK